MYYFSRIVLGLSLMTGLSAEEFKELSSEHSHEPEFYCIQQWQGSVGKVTASYEKGNFTREFHLADWPQGKSVFRQEWSSLAAGLWKLYYMDVNKDGVKELIAVLYNGTACGEAARYNEVDYWFKDGSIHTIRVKDVDTSKFVDYYQTSMKKQQ